MVATSKGQGAPPFSRAPQVIFFSNSSPYLPGGGVGTTVVPASAQAPPLAFRILGGEGG